HPHRHSFPTRRSSDLLQNKVALVTGGGRDIGRAIALELASAGAAVAVNYHASADGANAVVRDITDRGGQAVAIGADVSRGDDARDRKSTRLNSSHVSI